MDIERELRRLTALAEEFGGEKGADLETNLRNLAALKIAACAENQRLQQERTERLNWLAA